MADHGCTDKRRPGRIAGKQINGRTEQWEKKVMTTMLDKLSRIKTDLTLLKWMVAFNIAMNIAVVGTMLLSR
jgi:hypothetical protein